MSHIYIDALGNGDIQLAITSDRPDKVNKANRIITGLPQRTARALANRILHELDFAEGKRDRRPSTPHLSYHEILPCMDCGRQNATPCAGRSGRPCPISETGDAA